MQLCAYSRNHPIRCSDSNWTIMDAKQSPTDVKLGIVYIEASLLDCFMMDLRASILR